MYGYKLWSVSAAIYHVPHELRESRINTVRGLEWIQLMWLCKINTTNAVSNFTACRCPCKYPAVHRASLISLPHITCSWKPHWLPSVSYSSVMLSTYPVQLVGPRLNGLLVVPNLDLMMSENISCYNVAINSKQMEVLEGVFL